MKKEERETGDKRPRTRKERPDTRDDDQGKKNRGQEVKDAERETGDKR
jgi:hypothetical protein